MADTIPPSICGIGTDIVEIERIKTAIERHGDRFLSRLFTENERLYCERFKDSIPRFAGRFAAKEAVLKAFGTGLKGDMEWKEVEIVNDPNGKPLVNLSSRLLKLLGVRNIFISISHCQAYATATAIVVA